MINKVYLCDCMDFMGDKPDKYYDLAIVDPPYGIHDKLLNGKGFMKNSPQRLRYKEKQWDKKPNNNYFIELFRISKNQIICGGNYFNLPPSRGIIAWVKPCMKNHPAFSQWEMIWSSFDKSAKVFYSNTAVLYGKTFHPTQKPVVLGLWLLQKYAKPGWKILDTHVGSGYMRKACHQLGFDFEGCEIDPIIGRHRKMIIKNLKTALS